MSGITTLLRTSPMSGSDAEFFKTLAEEKGFGISSFSSLAGGSINQVYLLETLKGKKVLKMNDSSRYPGMFSAEKEGLEALRNSGAIDVPKVLDLGEISANSYLLLEHKKEAAQKAIFGTPLLKVLRNSTGIPHPNSDFRDLIISEVFRSITNTELRLRNFILNSAWNRNFVWHPKMAFPSEVSQTFTATFPKKFPKKLLLWSTEICGAAIIS